MRQWQPPQPRSSPHGAQLANSAVRAEAEKALGNRFDIHAFHDELLKDGALPISMLQAKMARWIDTTSR